MAITITVDNDRSAGATGIQPLIADETTGVQLPTGGGDDGNEVDVTLTAGALGGFATPFNTFLNSAPLALTLAQKQYAADHDGASSSSQFVLVTTTAGETISDLFFANSTGGLLAGVQVAGMTTLDGQSVYLWSNGNFGSTGDFCVATTSSTAGAGEVVAAFYLNEASNHLSAQVQMVVFEPIQHNLNGADPDDAVNFTDALRVGASGTLSFDFDQLASQSSLWVAVGNSSEGVLVTGLNPDVDNSTGKKTNDSDVIHSSQGGTDATIGLNNQLFDGVGETGVFTFVTGMDSLVGADSGVLSDYVIDDAGGQGIDYGGYIQGVTGAGVFISQDQGSPAAVKSLDINVFRTNNTTPEEGFGYVYADGAAKTGDALTDDIAVNVKTVTVTNKQGAIVAVWSTSPTGTQVASGSTVGGVQVMIAGNNIDVNNFGVEYTISWTVVDGQTMNRFQVVNEAGAWDVGRVDVQRSIPGSTPVGDQLFVEDDGPSISGSITGAPTLTVDETVLATNASGNFAPQFTSILGTDGGAATPVSYALSTPGGNSGLVDVATGENVVLSANAGVIEGRTATTNLLVFTVSVNSSGVVSLDQIRAIVHPNAADPDDAKTLGNANLVVMTATARDGDNDSAAASINIGQQLVFEDDGPGITGTITNAPILTVDETVLATNATGNFAPQFSPVFGADGAAAAASVSYALSTPGGNSGLVDVATGQNVVLSLVSGVVQGRTATSNELVFTVSVSSSGVVTLDQIRAVVHPNAADPDDAKTLGNANLVVLSATATDKDGDTAVAPLNIGQQLIFEDDGPGITASITNAPVLTVDETVLATNASGNFAPQFSPSFGADGAGATPVSYALSTPGGASGLTDTATGESIVLSLVGGVVQGRTVTTDLLCFTVSVSSSGVVSLDQIRAIVHPNTADPDDSKGLLAANLVVLTATATDKDGDQASAPLNIGQQLAFEDDGPGITASATGAPALTVDETLLATNATGNFAPQFSPTFGADGAGATPVGYALSTPGGASGLVDTATGQNVVLSLVGGVVQGRTATSNDLVFTVSVSSTGVVTLDQIRSIVHANAADPDDSRTLSAANLVVLTATATDKDGDQASAPLNIGQLLNFEDDGPAIGPVSDGIVDFAAGSSVQKTLAGLVGADGKTNPYTLTAYTAGLTVNGVALQAVAVGSTQVGYWGDTNKDSIFGNAGDTEYYRLVLGDQAGPGNYTFTVLVNPPPALLQFDFTDLPSGQNLLGVVAADKADLTKGGILVMPTNPDINDGEAGESNDGTMTNDSGTVNTSKGGGPVTIGNANQAFDGPSEGAFFIYVDNPDPGVVGGRDLSQTNADDADTVKFDGTIEVTSASVEIVQASGAGTAKRPGPATHITAYDLDPQTVGHLGDAGVETDSRDLVMDPTATDDQVNIIGVKIYDETGKLIEFRTNLQNGALTNNGSLNDTDDAGTGVSGEGGSDDSAVLIVFNRDGLGGAGNADDIYSATVSNLKANYTIEWVTAAVHDAAKVEWVAGSYDIGGFNLRQAQPSADQVLEFTARVTDGDGDFASDTWKVGIDGTGINDDGVVAGVSPAITLLALAKTAGVVDDSGMRLSSVSSLDSSDHVQRDYLVM